MQFWSVIDAPSTYPKGNAKISKLIEEADLAGLTLTEEADILSARSARRRARHMIRPPQLLQAWYP